MDVLEVAVDALNAVSLDALLLDAVTLDGLDAVVLGLPPAESSTALLEFGFFTGPAADGLAA